jgi:hypothetical protein
VANSKARQFSKELSEFSAECYRLSSDGRKWKAVAAEREKLAEFLGKYANPDGTSITIGTERMIQKMKPLTRATTFRRLGDLEVMGIMTRHGKTGENGTTVRHLHLEPLQRAKTALIEWGEYQFPDNRCEVSNTNSQVLNSSQSEVSNSAPEVSNRISHVSNTELKSQIAVSEVSNHSETQPYYLPNEPMKPTATNQTADGGGGNDFSKPEAAIERKELFDWMEVRFHGDIEKTLVLYPKHRESLANKLDGVPEEDIKYAFKEMLARDQGWGSLDSYATIVVNELPVYVRNLLEAENERKSIVIERTTTQDQVDQRLKELAEEAAMPAIPEGSF